MQDFFSESLSSQNIESEKIEFNIQYKELLEKNGFNSLTDFIFAPRENSYRDVPGRITVGIDLKCENGTQRAYLKRHWTLSASKSTGPHKEALAEWNNIKNLTQQGISVPDAMAVGHGYINGHSVGFIIMKEVPGKPADDFIKEDLNPLDKIQFIKTLAEFSAEFHNMGYNHRDFYLCHIFVNCPGEKFELNLIDLQRVQKRQLFRRRWIVKDLAQMAYSSLNFTSRTDRLRFYLKYAGIESLSAADKKIIEAVNNKVSKMVKREKEGKVR